LILYLDTSALFKLYVDEAGSDAVHAAVAAAEAVTVCRIAWADAMSALARREREVPADQDALEQARQALRTDWPRFLVARVGCNNRRALHRMFRTHKKWCNALCLLHPTALIKLYVTEPGSDETESLREQADLTYRFG
jgi:predicted nucleic acid-binding protein